MILEVIKLPPCLKKTNLLEKKLSSGTGRNQDGLLVSAGVYYFRLSSGSIIETIKLSMVK